MWKQGSLLVLGALGVSGVAYADACNCPATQAADVEDWAMQAQAGFARTSGNSDTTSANYLLHVAHVMGDWKTLLGTEGFYGATNGETTAQRWALHGQLNYNISSELYWYGKLGYVNDRFSGFAYQEVIATGVGYQFINTPDTKLAGQVGIGERRQRPETFMKDPAGGIVSGSVVEANSESDTVADATVNFEHAFNPSTKLLAAVNIISGTNDTSTTASLGLQVKMSSLLSLAAGYQLINNSKVPAGVKRTDTLATLSLVYELKNPKLAPQ